MEGLVLPFPAIQFFQTPGMLRFVMSRVFRPVGQTGPHIGDKADKGENSAADTPDDRKSK